MSTTNDEKEIDNLTDLFANKNSIKEAGSETEAKVKTEERVVSITEDKLVIKKKIIKKPTGEIKEIPKEDVETVKVKKEEEEEKTQLTDELKADFDIYFKKCVQGYHMINDDPIKESPWEDINAQIFGASKCPVELKSNGSHKSGADIKCSLGSFSNKSTKYESGEKSFKISSYRLTNVCSDKDNGTADGLVEEINRRKNFNYYSIVVRKEESRAIRYDWYLIPADYAALNPSSYEWSLKIGKQGKNKDSPVGWETNTTSSKEGGRSPTDGSSMSCTFSMSSQLWMEVAVTDELKKYMVSSCEVVVGRSMNYIQLWDGRKP
jgi:hypothetical protein